MGRPGKSASIIAVFEALKDRVSRDKIKKLSSEGDTDDVVCSVTYRDVKIGIESQRGR